VVLFIFHQVLKEPVPDSDPRPAHESFMHAFVLRRFRVKLERWLDTIRTVWPDCPARISSDGRTLALDTASAVHQIGI